MTEDELLPLACEQFLGKSVMEIKSVVLQTLEGHLRSILGERFKKKFKLSKQAVITTCVLLLTHK